MNLIDEINAAKDKALMNPNRRTGNITPKEILENFSDKAKAKWKELNWLDMILDESNDRIKIFGRNMGVDVENL